MSWKRCLGRTLVWRVIRDKIKHIALTQLHVNYCEIWNVFLL